MRGVGDHEHSYPLNNSRRTKKTTTKQERQMQPRTAPPSIHRIDPRVRAFDRISLTAPVASRQTRREFLIGAGSLLALGAAGCGGGEDESTPGETRTVRHALGTTEVPARPERLAIIDDWSLDFALGVKPYATTPYIGDEFVPYLSDEELEGIELLPLNSQFEPSLESLSAIEPDLIVGLAYYESIYDQLSEIAPTVLIEDMDDPLEFLPKYGEVLGVGDRVEPRIEEFEEKAAEARRKLERAPGDEKVAFVNIRSDEFRLYGGDGYTSILYDQIGLEAPRIVRERALDEYNIVISLELLPELDDAGHILVEAGLESEGDDAVRENLGRLEESPLWKNLPAVQSGNVHRVDQGTWLNNGLLGDEVKIEDALEALAGGGN